jgi:glycosyltransferase involved in cell wall biosynthesis
LKKEEKKSILVFVGQFYPTYKNGGPLQSISNMLELGWKNHSFKVVTQNNPLWINNSSKEENNYWKEVGNISVYSSHSKFPPRKKIIEAYCDVYYLNSFFSFQYSIMIVLMQKLKLIPQKKIILAPRGEFSAGALSLKRIKKRTFLSLAKSLRIYNNVIWHASTIAEAEGIKKEFGENISVRIALDISNYKLKVPDQIQHKKNKNQLKILFISRISRIKNLKFVIETLNKSMCDFSLDIYGPIEDEKYWLECKRSMGTAIIKKVNYRGVVNNTDIANIYPNYDLLFLPTLGENYGHVIYESLALGVPVLCSDKTPWSRLDEFYAGWNINLNNKDGFIEVIEKLSKLDCTEYEKYKAGCFRYIEDLKNDKKHVLDNLRLFD